MAFKLVSFSKPTAFVLDLDHRQLLLGQCYNLLIDLALWIAPHQIVLHREVSVCFLNGLSDPIYSLIKIFKYSTSFFNVMSLTWFAKSFKPGFPPQFISHFSFDRLIILSYFQVSDQPCNLSPQGLCTCCSLLLKCSSPLLVTTFIHLAVLSCIGTSL